MISNAIVALLFNESSPTEPVESVYLPIPTPERRSNNMDMTRPTIPRSVDVEPCQPFSTTETSSIHEASTQFPHTNDPVAA